MSTNLELGRKRQGASHRTRLMSDLRSSTVAQFSQGSGLNGARTLYFLVLDSILLVSARLISEHFGTAWEKTWSIQETPSMIFVILSIQIIVFSSYDLYQSGKKRRDYSNIIKAVFLSNLILLLIAFLYLPQALIARSTFLLTAILSLLFISVGRYISNLLIIQVWKRGFIRHPVFVIAAPSHIKEVTALVSRAPYHRLCGSNDLDSINADRIDETLRQIQLLGVSEVFVHSTSALRDPMHLYWKLRNKGITIYMLSSVLEPLFREEEFGAIEGVPCAKFSAPFLTGLDFWTKRIIDFIGALVFLVITSPVYFAVALVIAFDSRGPIFYRQTRIGLRGKPFKVWKFRTMVTNADEIQAVLEKQNECQDGILFKMKSDPRITQVGSFLRQYSLDELPQVFNILLGEMSFVGPRPLPTRDVEHFAQHHHIRHEVLPGITGLWQVSGRSEIKDFESVFRLDIQYIENWSLWYDLKIVLKTIAAVFQKAGAY
jgi:exopolysaccharide biosynthesis polyprenyl glycosylphosphotransferase